MSKPLYELFCHPTPALVDSLIKNIEGHIDKHQDYYSDTRIPLDYHRLIKMHAQLDMVTKLALILSWLCYSEADMQSMLQHEHPHTQQQFPVMLKEMQMRCIRGLRLDTGMPFEKPNKKKGIPPPTQDELTRFASTQMMVMRVQQEYARMT